MGRLFRLTSLRRRMLSIYLIVIFLPMMLMVQLLYKRAERIIAHEVTQSSWQTLQQIANHISYRMSVLVSASDTLAMDPKLYKHLTDSSPDLWSQVETTKALRDLISVTESNRDIYRVRLFCDSDQLFTHDHYNFFSFANIGKEPWYQQALQSSRHTLWQNTYWIHYAAEADQAVTSLVRTLRDVSDYDRILGFLLLDIRQQFFMQIVSAAAWTGKGELYVVDSGGEILSHQDPGRIGQQAFEPELRDEMSGEMREGIRPFRDGYLLACGIDGTGWYVAVSLRSAGFSANIWSHEAVSLLLYGLMAMVLIAVLTFAVSAVYAGTISRHTKELVLSIQKLGFSHLDEALPAADHPDALEYSINGLILTLKKLADESYAEKLHAQKMELQLLQSQINPHFLYNAIDAIYWKAVRQGVPDVAQLLSTLARYFRLTLNKGRDFVCVGDEIALLKAYAALQKNRFGQRFTLEYLIDEEALPFGLPKLTLQPLAENALIHGILKKEENGNIHLIVRREEASLYFEMRDDGVGIGESYSFADAEPSKGYGLYNVNRRLSLTFGEAYGLHVEPIETGGTRVWFRVPPQRVLDEE